ncbi:Protein sym1 [Gigaspora margarita]|uniref:Protein sym1 n=2 Tax=Gigaspora margarita TaxID=4874 RepID=A0A8H4EN80_GIGMA|nr:Protein sym1 [Gigaspora margarita]
MSVFISWYKYHLLRRPILTQSIATGIIFTSGDIIAQGFIEQRGHKTYDFSRTLRLGGFGALIAGPSGATWYRILDKYIDIKKPFLALLTRVTLDQTIYAPSFIATFLSVQSILERQSKEQIVKKFKKVYLPTLINNYKLWPTVQLLNFYFIPLNHRLLVVNTVALGWNTYLSIVNKRGSDIVG